MHSPPPKIWEENVGASYSPNVAYLAGWAGPGGGRSQDAEQGRCPRKPKGQEWGDAAGPGLGEGGVPAVQSKGGRRGVPGAAYYSAREEGTGGAGVLGEESLWRPYVPPSPDWCVPLTLT